MSARFQELDWRQTPLGEVSLRRRRDPVLGADVYEVKLGEEFLMSSMFTLAETEAARLALARLSGEGLEVAVGGLGLGYTAQAVLAEPAVESLVVVEALEGVIEWHRRELVPAGAALVADSRCRLVQGDFFAMVAGSGLDPARPGRRFHAVILDIDHSPRHLLHPDHAPFYRPEGVSRLGGLLYPGGVFALWSNDPPDADFVATLAGEFVDVTAEVVRFPNPLQGGESTNTVYLATRPPR